MPPIKGGRNHKGFRTTAILRPVSLKPRTRTTRNAERTRSGSFSDSSLPATPVVPSPAKAKTVQENLYSDDAIMGPARANSSAAFNPRPSHVRYDDHGNQVMLSTPTSASSTLAFNSSPPTANSLLDNQGPVIIAEPTDTTMTPEVIQQRIDEQRNNQLVSHPLFSSKAVESSDEDVVSEDEGNKHPDEDDSAKNKAATTKPEPKKKRAYNRTATKASTLDNAESSAIDRLERVIPPQVLDLARAELSNSSNTRTKKAKTSAKNAAAAVPGREAVVMTAARNMIVHLSKSGQGMEAMNTELGRIAKERGEQVALREKEVGMLRGVQ